MFFSSCAAVKYHAELLNYIDIPVKDIHGKQKQQRRTTTFHDFCKAESVSGALPACRQAPAASPKHVHACSTHVASCICAPFHTQAALSEPAQTVRCVCGVGHAAVYGRGGAWAGHPGGGLDHPVRSARRPQGVHPSRGPHRARALRPRSRAAAAAARRGWLPALSAGAPRQLFYISADSSKNSCFGCRGSMRWSTCIASKAVRFVHWP